MHTLSASAIQVVADDTRSAFATFDNAILGSARLTVSMLEAHSENPLPAAEGQKVLQAVYDGMGKVIAGRADIVSATKLLRLIKARSNQAETGLGCAGEGPLMAKAVVTPTAIRANQAA